jgi:diadenylate cyclase
VILATFLLWKVVGLLEFRLLTTILDAFLGLGAVAVVIIFAPEIRLFLSDISKNTLLDRLLQKVGERNDTRTSYFDIIEAIRDLRARGEGALIVLPGANPLREIEATGERLDANITARLIFTIFQKESPLHDGAMIIANGKITSVRCILPISENQQLPPDLGLRHRAALGLSEISDALVLAISEERREVSIAYRGELNRAIDYHEVEDRLQRHLGQVLV